MLVANRGFALASSRTELIERLIASGHRVYIVTSDDQYSRGLVKLGANLLPLYVERGGVAIIRDIQLWRRLFNLYQQYKPDLIHHFHAKPLIVGSLAARRAINNRVKVVNTVTGLGHSFIRGGVVQSLARLGYRVAGTKADITIFQNNDDMDLFFTNNWVKKGSARLIVGSGVSTDRFRPRDDFSPDSPARILMVGRLIWQKGIKEFVESAQIIKAEFPEVVFQLAGEWDPVHPDAVPRSYIEEKARLGIIEFLGYRSDMPELLAGAYTVVLPSFREGLPRVVLEAAATGIPCIGADVPGTREAIIDGVSGFLVAAQQTQPLADKMRLLLESGDLRKQMAQASREMSLHKFDINRIVDLQLNVYRELGIDVIQAT